MTTHIYKDFDKNFYDLLSGVPRIDLLETCICCIETCSKKYASYLKKCLNGSKKTNYVLKNKNKKHNSLIDAVNACGFLINYNFIGWANSIFQHCSRYSNRNKMPEFISWLKCFYVESNNEFLKINKEVLFLDGDILRDYLIDYNEHFFTNNTFNVLPSYVKIKGKTLDKAITKVLKHPFALKRLRDLAR